MGQYHCIYNLDKKEYLRPHGMGDGTKLLEFGVGGPTVAGLCVLLANSNGRGGGDLNVHREYTKDFKPKPLKGIKALWQDAIDAVAGRWSGDRIVIQGDYAEEGDPAFIPEEQLKGFKDISPLVIKALSADEYLREEHLKQRGILNDRYVIQHVIDGGDDD